MAKHLKSNTTTTLNQMEGSTNMSESLAFLAGKVYTSPDLKYSFPLDALPEATIITAITRAFNHVFGNEALAKAGVKGVSDLSPERNGKLTEVREAYRVAMFDGTWGSGTRATRMPAANREEQIYNNLLAADTRAALNKDSRISKGEADDTWINPKTGEAVPLADWMAVYVRHSEVGESRKADLKQRAADKYAAELKDAEHRRAAKATASAGFEL